MKKQQYIVFILIVALILGAIYLFPKLHESATYHNDVLLFKEDVVLEVGDVIDAKDLIEATSAKQIIYPSIDTSSANEKSVDYIVITEEKQSVYTLHYKVLEKSPPELMLSKYSLTLELGESFNPQSMITRSFDTFDGEVETKIEGSFDTSKEGNYELSYITCDRDHACTTKQFVLTVQDSTKKEEQTSPTSPAIPPTSPTQPTNPINPPVTPITPNKPYTPSQSVWLYSDGYNKVSGFQACLVEFNQLSSAECVPLFGEDGLDIGYQLVY